MLAPFSSLSFCFTETSHFMPSGIEDIFPLVCMTANTLCELPVQGIRACAVPTRVTIPRLLRFAWGLWRPQHGSPLSWGQRFASVPWLERISLKKSRSVRCHPSLVPQWAAEKKNAEALGSFPLWTCEPVLWNLNHCHCFAVSVRLTSTRKRAFSLWPCFYPIPWGPKVLNLKVKWDWKSLKRKFAARPCRGVCLFPGWGEAEVLILFSLLRLVWGLSTGN